MPGPSPLPRAACRPRRASLLLTVLAAGICAAQENPSPAPSPEKPDMPAHTNRLARESSPYLLQHAHNPVDWFAWGAEAFEKAKKENKPVFLSVGYSTCHWCHVMERESFEKEDVAAILNEHFVSIKVDREERPDVDQVYMAAVQAMAGQGGWPMSVFLTPEGKPFFGGTYFPPEDRFGRTGFKSLLLSIAKAWKEQHEKVLDSSRQITEALAGQSAPPDRIPLDDGTLRVGANQFAQGYDGARAGFGDAPKFPRSHVLSFLLRYWKRTGDRMSLKMTEETLDAMARGGMYDQVGGGFHRYSTDAQWLVPHFEKMLYDQALLARSYLEAYQATGKADCARVAGEIFTYVLRDMTDPGGGFYSAEDADSEGVEGKFYVWKASEISEVLGAGEAAAFCRAYGIEAGGNFHEEASGHETGLNIPHLPKRFAGIADDLKTDAAALRTRLDASRAKLFAVREKRIHPHKDDKILTAWNGLMISAFCVGAQALDRADYADAARKAAAFVLDHMQRNGRLLARCRKGQADILAYLDDYAFFIQGLVDLYETTLELRWLDEARRLAGEMIRLFRDPKEGAFHFSGTDGEKLILKKKDVYDGAIPSGNSVAALALRRLGRLLQDSGLEKEADGILQAFSGTIVQYPAGYPYMLMALDFAVGPTQEIVLAGDPADPGLVAMRKAVQQRFLPSAVWALHPTGPGAADVETRMPFLKTQGPVGGKPAAYVCRNYACQAPVTELEKFEALLDAETGAK